MLMKLIALTLALMMTSCGQTVPEKTSPTPGDETTTDGAEVSAVTVTEHHGELSYLLYEPAEVSGDLPLIVYLHGGSGKGDDLSLLTSVDGLPEYLADGKVAPDAYVVMPQLTSDHKGWVDVGEDIMKLIGALEEEYSIDPDRVSLTGHSMGGTGVWQLALAYPGSFSAIAPLSGSVMTNELNLKKLSKLSVRAVVGSDDTIVSPESSEKFIAALSRTNSEASLITLDGYDHFDVPTYYLDSDAGLLDWLISRKK